MSAVSLRASFYLYNFRNDWVRKDGLGSISIGTTFRSNLPSPGEDRLVLLSMAACLCRNAMAHIEFVKGIPTALEQEFFLCEQTEFDRV